MRAMGMPLHKTMSAWLMLVAALCLLVGISSAGQAGVRPAQAAGPQTPRPNIVFILTDDQRPDQLARMPIVASQLIDKGVTFTNSFVSNPLCCPSRVTDLTGQTSGHTG